MNIRFSLKKIYSQIPSFAKSGRHSLAFLNMAQFLGVINDNIFKFVMAYLLIDALGFSEASTILSATGAIYVIPFLLFSSSAGILADRLSKQKLLVIMKIAEIIVMALAIVAFTVKSVWGCYTLLFLLSTHSATFGPSKYGIIPELVPSDAVSKANGLITSFTYLAIIIGTFLASFLTDMTDRHFTWIALFCLFVAMGGLVTALWIKQTPAQGSNKKMNLLFVRDIYKTLKNTRQVQHLLPAIFGSAFFLGIGAFTQLNIIPFGLQALNLSEVAGGYLFLVTALGIALGSFIAGRISRKRIELGLTCIAGFGIFLFFNLIAIFSFSLVATVICLMFIGILGGAFIVPLDTFIQLNSDGVNRGQTIGAANFLSFACVLLASFSIYFFNKVCGLSSAASFAVVGWVTLGFTVFLSLRFSNLFFSFLSRTLLYPCLRFKRPNNETIEAYSHDIFIMEKASWRDAILLTGAFPQLHFLIPSDSKKLRWYHSLFFSIHRVAEEDNVGVILAEAKELQRQEILPCVMLSGSLEGLSPKGGLFKRGSQTVRVRLSKDPETKKLTLSFQKP